MVEAEKYSFSEEILSKPPKGWKEFFSLPEIKALLPRIEKLIQEKDAGKMIVPLPENLFNAFHYIRPENIRVVLTGQDPYHNLKSDGSPAAMGMSFSCWEDAPIQPSLRTMFKEAVNYYEGKGITRKIPDCGDLTYLCIQGVFLFNTALTTRVGEPKSHVGMWEGFSKYLLSWLYTKNKKLIFLLMGREAQKFCDKCKESSNFNKIECGHPSPMNSGFNAFLGCGVFKKVNDTLASLGEDPIEWLDE